MLLFETVGLCKFYRPTARTEIRALDAVSLGVEPASITAIRGTSGSGKSTLLSVLGGLERPSAGRVLFDGKDLASCSDNELARCRRRMGFIFQDFGLIPNLTALENITYPLIPRSVRYHERLRRARELLARFALQERSGLKCRELSGGEQQRVALARALAGRPEVILADEPTSNLDSPLTVLVLEVLHEMHAAGGTVIVTSHDPAVLEVCTRVHTLRAGKLVA
jgi:putative ABC transport system ATP-binding protein